MRLFLTTVCVLLLSYVRTTFGANILAVVPCPARSHFSMFEPLIVELTKRGHKLWVVSHFPQETTGSETYYTDIDVSGTTPTFHNNVSLEILDLYTDNYLWLYYNLVDFFEEVKLSARLLETNEIKQLLKTDVKFDLIISELFTNDIFIGFSYKFKAPLIAIVSSIPLPWSSDRVSNIENPSYTTNVFSLCSDRMDFTQRLVNTVNLAFSKLAYAYFNYYAEGFARKFFGEDLPPLSSLLKNTSMMFVNSFPALNGARPNTPQVVEIGGIHMKPAKQLPHVSNVI